LSPRAYLSQGVLIDPRDDIKFDRSDESLVEEFKEKIWFCGILAFGLSTYRMPQAHH
jgi:hypothetical protein